MQASGAVLLLTLLLMVPTSLVAESPSVIEVVKFSSGMVGQAMPEGWKSPTFIKIPKQTVYELVKDGDAVVVKAGATPLSPVLSKQSTSIPRNTRLCGGDGRWRTF